MNPVDDALAATPLGCTISSNLPTNSASLSISMEILSINLIASDPNVRGGRPMVAGTGVRVTDIASVKLFHLQNPEGIAAWFGLLLAQVYAALAHYYEHQEAFDRVVRVINELVKRAQDLQERHVGSRYKSLFE